MHDPAAFRIGDHKIDAVIFIARQLFQGHIDGLSGRSGPQHFLAENAARLGIRRWSKFLTVAKPNKQSVLIYAQPSATCAGIDATQHARLASLNGWG